MKTPDYVVTNAETPEYLTTGKRYPVIDFDAGPVANMLGIYDDDGDGISILDKGCAHIDFGNWKKGYTFHV